MILKKSPTILSNIIIVFSSVIFSLFLGQYFSDLKDKNSTIKILNTTISSIEDKERDLMNLNLIPLFDYKANDTLLVYKEPIYFEYDLFYEQLLEGNKTKLDSEFYLKISRFKKRHKKLKNIYNEKQTDALRKKIRKSILLQMGEEKEILRGEKDYLENKISKDSLKLVRTTAFRKYVNFEI